MQLLPTLSVVVLLSALPVARSVAQTPASAGTDEARVVNDFKVRAEQYVQFREKAGPAPKSSKAPEAIVARQQQLAEKIRVARARAKQGDIFAPEIAQYFRRQIAASLRGSHAQEILASLRHAEPVKMKLGINQSYPDNIPLQSTPPTLLLNLPALADGLEYRIVNRELVLRDSEANIVVDYIPNALPEAPR